jgi:predicted amidophosphoribosyltransferase
MDVATVATITLFVVSLLSVVLMAFFALKPERGGPKCPRCDKSLPAAAERCPQCGLALEQRG